MTMNEIFKIYEFATNLYQSNNELLLFLFDILDDKNKKDDKSPLYRLLLTDNKINTLKVYQLIGLVHQKKKESESIVNTNARKHYGIYYTDYSIARILAKESLGGIQKKQFEKLTFYEPCVGSGIFVIAYIDEIVQQNPKVDLQKVINNIYFSDIDKEAVNLFIKLLPLYINNKYRFSIKIPSQNYFIGDALFKKQNGKIIKNNPKDIFRASNSFDIILTNPPYKLLKANANKYKDANDKNKHSVDIKEVVQFIRKNKIYKYNQGILNYYKIFLEEILENYTHKTSKIGVLIPITLLNDKQSELLRKRIINHYKLNKIYIIPEKNNFFPDISQAFCFFSLDKTLPGDVIKITPNVINRDSFNNDGIEIKISHIEKISSTAPIVIENKIGWKILKKLNNLPKLGSLSSVRNARGELDLTLDKDFITKNRTRLPLLRGNNVSEFSYTLGEYFTDEDFINKAGNKSKYINSERIVCQQISNIHLEKRLKFAKVPGNVVLGNSCNFLTFDESLFGQNDVSLDYLLGVLNSLLLNWRFKVTNSNNHISNYELAELPIVIPNKKDKKEVEKLVLRIREENDLNAVYELNMKIFDLYGLTKEEIDYVLGKHEKTVRSILNFKTNNLFNYANI